MSRQQIMIVAHNLETGAIGNHYLPADEDPQKIRAALIRDFGKQVGTIFDIRPDGPQVPIGTIHQAEAPYPDGDRTFVRQSYAFVAPGVPKMSDEKRAAYLAAVLGDDAKPAKAEKGKLAPAPVDEAPKAKGKKVKAETPAPVKASAKAPPKKRR